jgi:predicted aspartyl protease
MAGFLDNQDRALLRLRIRGKGEWITMTAEIDTGAEPSLVTSMAWAQALDAEVEAKHVATLANGQHVPAHLMAIEIDWFGQTTLVDGIAFDDDQLTSFATPGQRGPKPNALLGRSQLKSSRLTIDYGRRTVAIEPSEGLPA